MNALHTLLPPGCKSRQRGPILPTKPHGGGPQPQAPAGARPEAEVAVARCKVAAAGRVTLPCTLCQISAQRSPISSSTRLERRSGQTGFYPSPSPKPSAPRGGSGHARTPLEEAPWGAMPRVPEQGSPSSVPHSPLAAVQPIQPPRPPQVWLAASRSGNCRHLEPSV